MMICSVFSRGKVVNVMFNYTVIRQDGWPCDLKVFDGRCPEITWHMKIMTWGTRGGTMICVIIEISPGETEIAGYPVQETPHGQMSVRRVRPGDCKEPKAFAASGRVQAQCLPRSHVWPDQAGECEVSVPPCKQQRKSWISIIPFS